MFQVQRALAALNGDSTGRNEMIVSDIEHMIGVISKLSSMQDLIKEIPNIQGLIDFALDILEFAKNVVNKAPVTPEL